MFFDPMVVGIFGGDIRTISVRACFPEFKRLEEQYGSVTKGMFAKRKEKKGQSKYSADVPNVPLSAVFSFRSGMEELTQSLVNQIPATIRYNCEAKEVAFAGDGVSVKTGAEEFTADYLFCALPVKETERLFEKHVPDLSKELSKVHSEGMTVINFGYDAEVLPVQGFGYLIPTHAREDLLGVIFDSSALASHNKTSCETRLTIMLPENGRPEEVLVDTAIKGIRRHLGINRMPTAVSFKRASRAIPQYGVGHLEKMEEVLANFRKKLPRCQLVGNYIKGTSVNFCIDRAKEAVDEWRASLECPPASIVFESQFLS
jgi:oxygen-dependent protoporphyrinogen oxidase